MIDAIMQGIIRDCNLDTFYHFVIILPAWCCSPLFLRISVSHIEYLAFETWIKHIISDTLQSFMPLISNSVHTFWEAFCVDDFTIVLFGDNMISP